MQQGIKDPASVSSPLLLKNCTFAREERGIGEQLLQKEGEEVVTCHDRGKSINSSPSVQKSSQVKEAGKVRERRFKEEIGLPFPSMEPST